MKVQDAMASTISTASPRDPLRKVAQLMKQEDAGSSRCAKAIRSSV
jgi:hypothetical protein